MGEQVHKMRVMEVGEVVLMGCSIKQEWNFLIEYLFQFRIIHCPGLTSELPFSIFVHYYSCVIYLFRPSAMFWELRTKELYEIVLLRNLSFAVAMSSIVLLSDVQEFF